MAAATILIVDDERATRELPAEVFEDAGYAVVAARDAAAGLAALGARAVGLVLLDPGTGLGPAPDLALLRAALEEEGYRVAAAPDGAEALRLARARPPALVVLDLWLPAMDGWAFARAYRREVPAPAPIVCATAVPLDPARRAELAAAAVLRKPFDLDRLFALVADLAGAPRPAAPPLAARARA